MTRDEIIHMAREADFGFYGGPDENGIPRDSPVGMKAITRFAVLIEQRAVAAEREACAKVCESLAKEFKNTGGRPYDWKSEGAEDCAHEIRARGEP